LIVVDASAVLEVVLNTEVGEALADRWLGPESSVHAPQESSK